MDSSHLKVELKTWERNFFVTTGRKPTVLDIKDDPIAAKYRLHKQLTRRSQTPPPVNRPDFTTSFIPKSQPEQSTEPFAQFNPFSPRRKHARDPSLNLEPATPTKQREHRSTVGALKSPTFLSQHSTHHSTSDGPNDQTLLKERKRLRGDPVTPSPKGKKRRIFPGGTSASDRSPATTGLYDANPNSALDESPIKEAGRNYNALFDGGLYPLSETKIPLTNHPFFPARSSAYELEIAESESNSTRAILLSTTKTSGVLLNETHPRVLDIPPSIPSSSNTAEDQPHLLSITPPKSHDKHTKQLGKRGRQFHNNEYSDMDVNQRVAFVDSLLHRKRRHQHERNMDLIDDSNPSTSSRWVRDISRITEPSGDDAEINLPVDMHRILSLRDSHFEAMSRNLDEKALAINLISGRPTGLKKGIAAWVAGEGQNEAEQYDEWDDFGASWAVAEL